MNILPYGALLLVGINLFILTQYPFLLDKVLIVNSIILIIFAFVQLVLHFHKKKKIYYQCNINFKSLKSFYYRIEIPSNKLTRLSRSIEDILGYPYDDWCDNKIIFALFFHPEDRPEIIEIWRAIAKGVVPTEMHEYRALDKQGEEKWLLQSFTGIYDKYNKLIAVEGLCHDITKHKQQQEKQNNDPVNLQTLVDNLPDNLTLLDTQGHTLFSNHVSSPLSGKKGGNQSAFEYLPTEQQVQLKQTMQEVEQSGKSSYYETPVKVDNEASTWWGNHISAYKNKQNKLGFIILSHDITEEKQKETQRINHINYLEKINALEKILHHTTELKPLAKTIVKTLQTIFACDHVWLLQGAEQSVDKWKCIAEYATSHYQTLAPEPTTQPIYISPEISIKLSTPSPFILTQQTIYPPQINTKKHSTLIIPIHSQLGTVWLLGIQQFTSLREWQTGEKNLLQDIATRLSHVLSSVCLLETLQESEERLRNLIDALPDPICFKDKKGHWLGANAAMLHLLSIDKSLYYGKTDVQLMALPTTHQNNLHHCSLSDSTVWEAKKSLPQETVLHHPDLGERTYILTKVPTFSETQQKQALIIMGRDITDEKHAEEELRYSEARFRSTFKDAAIGMALVDKEGAFLQVNTALCEILGCNNTDIMNNTFFNLVDSNEVSLQQKKTRLQEILDGTRKEFKLEHNFIHHKTKEKTWVIINITPAYDDTKQFLYFICQFQDISELKKATIELIEERIHLARRINERTSELEAINDELARHADMKDEFLANMSHELRTPLNSILAIAESLQAGVYGDLTDKPLKNIVIIEDSGRHLLKLINEILDISKIEAGKLVLQKSPCALKETCQASIDLIKQTAANKSVKIFFSFDTSINTTYLDSSRLKQILSNLLSNAVKFTPNGKRVGLQVLREKDDKYLSFTVWDEGIGISEEDISQLFKPFVQIDSSLSRQYTGTGLGLALVQRLTQLHGGEISIVSKPDEGSRFTILLPYQKSELKESSSTDITSSQHIVANNEILANQENKESYDITTEVDSYEEETEIILQSDATILLAEDNEANISMISDYLSIKGYQLAIAHDGEEAIEKYEQHKPDIILMDIQMPRMDGLEAIRYIRTKELGHDDAPVPIIALTALAMTGDKEKCLAAGADKYLSKPVKLKELMATIEEIRLINGKTPEVIEEVN